MTDPGADVMKDAVKAAMFLSQLCREDDDLKYALVALASRYECVDLYEYAQYYPEEIIGIAEAQRDLLDQNPPGMKAL